MSNSDMNKFTGFWIRNNKNVQVRCYGVRKNRQGVDMVTVVFRNSHTRFIEVGQFLREFINLDDLLAEITKGSKWIAISSGHTICVTDVRARSGIVFYRIEDVPKEYSYGGTDIFRFKKSFRPHAGEVKCG